MRSTMGEVQILADPEAAALAAAELFADEAIASVARSGRFAVALSGGRTPRPMFAALACPPFLTAVPWGHIHVFVADERCVPLSDPESNFGMIDSLLLKRVSVSPDHVHPVDTSLAPPDAARAYSRVISDIVGPAGFDLVMLGVGEDGHVASLFPGSDALYVDRRGASAIFVHQLSSWRITLTLSEINSARRAAFIVTGPDKAATLADVASEISGLPAERVRPAQGAPTWVLDMAAASRLGSPNSLVATVAGQAEGGAASAPAPSAGGRAGAASPKQLAGEAAAEEVTAGMAVGLGTGSTARYATLAIARRLGAGAISDIVAVPTSAATAELAARCGIPLATLADVPRLDLTIDGADEVSPTLDLIKGMGGALLREKIVALASERFVVVAEASKRVAKLGTSSPLPVAVVPFGWTATLEALRALGAEPALRKTTDGDPVVSDDGLYIVDCRFDQGIDDPAGLDPAIRAIPGAVETGLFLGLADAAYLGELSRVLVLPPSP